LPEPRLTVDTASRALDGLSTLHPSEVAIASSDIFP